MDAPTSATTSVGEWLTIERLFYAVIVLTAGFMRFFALGAQPLNSDEAATSWIAWTAAMGFESRIGYSMMIESLPPTSPLLYSLQGLLFWIAGGSDALARFWPAMAGMALALLPWFVRHHLGRYTAIILALLLAIDPWLVAYSRVADGTSLSLFLGLLVIFGLSLCAYAERQQQERTIERKVGWQRAIWLGAGLLLISGPQAWSFLLVIAAFVLLNGLPTQLWGNVNNPIAVEDEIASENFSKSAIASGEESEQPSRDDETPQTDSLVEEGGAADPPVEVDSRTAAGNSGLNQPPSALWLFVGALLLGATGWLAFPDGLSYIGTSVSQWLAQIVGPSADSGQSYSLSWVILRFFVDQWLLFILGICGLFALWRSNRNDGLDIHGAETPIIRQPAAPLLEPKFLTVWFVIGLILLLVPGRGPFSFLMVCLPLLFSTASLLGKLAERFIAEIQPQLSDGLEDASNPWREVRFVVLTLSALLVLMGFIIAAQVESAQLSTSLLFTGVLVLIIIALLVVILALMIGWVSALRVFGLYAGFLLVVVGISNSWHLNHRFDVMQPDGFFAQTTSTDVRTLVEDIRTMSAQRIGDPEEVEIRAELGAFPDPVLAWNLRNMRNLQWTPSPATDGDLNSQVVLLTFGESVTSRAASESYLGSDYTLYYEWLPNQLPGFEAVDAGVEQPAFASMEQRWTQQLQPLVRWIVYRQITEMPSAEKVVLWTRGL